MSPLAVVGGGSIVGNRRSARCVQDAMTRLVPRLGTTLFVLAASLAGCGAPSSRPATDPTSACRGSLSPGHVTMPVPVRLVSIQAFGFNGLVLSPPPPGSQPAVPASHAWGAVHRQLQSGARYRLVLAEANSDEALGGSSPSPLLVWAVLGSHVPIPVRGDPERQCGFEAAMWPVNASTGTVLGELTYPPLDGFSTPTLRSGWMTVTYDGIGVDVPDDFTVEPWRASCGVTTPTVMVGPAHLFAMSCPAFTLAGALVVLGDIPPPVPGTALRLNGLSALVTTATSSLALRGIDFPVTSTRVEVTLPGFGVSVSVSAGESTVVPGGAPGRAEEIAQTIHAL